MLVLDVLDDRVPALVIVDEVSVTGGVNDVQLKTDAVLNDDCKSATSHEVVLSDGEDGVQSVI